MSALSAARIHQLPKLNKHDPLSAEHLAGGECSSEIELKPHVYRSRERLLGYATSPFSDGLSTVDDGV